MNEENLLREIWKVLNKKHLYGHQTSALTFAEALKEVDKNADYSCYKTLVNSLFERMGRQLDCLYLPTEFEWFIKSFIDVTNPSNVLIPCATGLECDWFSRNTSVKYRFLNKTHEQATLLFSDIKTIEDISESGEYNLIVSDLPFGSISPKFISCQIVEQCSKLLSEGGYCIFTFAKAITFDSSAKWLSKLEKMGLYCTAIIDMPIEAYAPVATVESEIVVFSKKKEEKLFVGFLSEKNFASTIVRNLLERKESTKDPKLGILVEGDIRCYSDYYNALRLRNKNRSLSKAYKAKILKINEIGEVHAPNKDNEFQERENAVYIPKLGKSPAVTTVADFQIKAQNYFQITVNMDTILPRFLAFFLNTEEGVNVRQLSYRGTTIKAFNTKTLGEMSVPCPTLKLQSEYLKTYDRLEILRVDIEALKDKMQKNPASYENIQKEIKDINNTGDKFAQWIESLPYPIATILKRYSVVEDPNKKQETLFYFYEAYAIFEATILCAALNKRLLDCSNLNGVDPEYFKRASFGNWVIMDQVLSNLFLKTINSPDYDKKRAGIECFKTTDENLIRLLCNKDVCKILKNASDYRNNWKGHTGITSEALYKEHVETLDSMLRKLQEGIKDLYDRIRLIRPVGLSYSNGIFQNKVDVLTGSNPIFIKDTINALNPLDNTKLYIQLLDTGDVLELPPFFILKNSPADAKNACYFYSKVEKGTTKYVSYHHEGKPEDIETGEFVFEHIMQLLTN